MKEKLKGLKPKHYIFILLGVLAIAVLTQLFFYHHVPVKMYFDEETQEVVISPGFLYTLDGYTIDSRGTIPADELSLLPLADPSEPDYRFRPIPGDHGAEEEIWIHYRDSLTGERLTTKIRSMRFNGLNFFDISVDCFILRLDQRDGSFVLSYRIDRRRG